MKLAKLATGFLTVSLIAACGGGGGGGSTGTTSGGGDSTSTASGGGDSTSTASGGSSTSSVSSISGVALDGYLYKALACLDLNNNLSCDLGEPSALTDINGRFVLNVSPEMAKAHSIVVMAKSLETIDSDEPNRRIKYDYTLTAPAGVTTISPLTTLLRAKMHYNMTQEQAADEIARIFSDSSVPILNPGTQSRVYDLTRDYIASKNDNLQKLGWALRNIIEISFKNPDFFKDFSLSVAESIVPNLNSIIQASDKSKIDKILSNDQFLGIFKNNGLHDFQHLGGNWFKFRSTQLDSNNVFKFTNFYAINQRNFTRQLDPEIDYWELNNTGWSFVSRAISLGTNPDDLVLFGGPYGNSGVRLTFERFELEGGVELSNIRPSADKIIYDNGSRGFKLSYTAPAHRFILSGRLPLAGPFQEQLTTLRDILNAYSSSAPPNYVNFVRSSTGLLMTFTPTADSAGTLTFRNPDVPNQVLVTGGSYFIQTVHGRQILSISEIPKVALDAVALTNPTARDDYNNGIRPFFAVGPNGGVFEGVYTPSGTITNPTLQLNRAALNSILKALSLCRLNWVNKEFVNDCSK